MVVFPCLVMEQRLAKRHYCANIGSTSGARAGAIVRGPCLVMQRKMGLYNSLSLLVISNGAPAGERAVFGNGASRFGHVLSTLVSLMMLTTEPVLRSILD